MRVRRSELIRLRALAERDRFAVSDVVPLFIQIWPDLTPEQRESARRRPAPKRRRKAGSKEAA